MTAVKFGADERSIAYNTKFKLADDAALVDE